MNAAQTDWLIVLFFSAGLWWLGYRAQQNHVPQKEVRVPAWLAHLLGSDRPDRVLLHASATQSLGLGLLVLMLLLSLTIEDRQARMDLWRIGFAALTMILALITVLFYLRE